VRPASGIIEDCDSDGLAGQEPGGGKGPGDWAFRTARQQAVAAQGACKLCKLAHSKGTLGRERRADHERRSPCRSARPRSQKFTSKSRRQSVK
jgi:hypothetical protein